ncbi:hypothetical protein QVD17_20619 [Tagetes erecta]|uniref:Transmembrane protein n=1 Tax=Tagetes erecta TaxID=13708 RepID=A0AAD8KLI2_TARER|nr:hypothetical protein QVD17_20619 [Tagetes erecta]
MCSAVSPSRALFYQRLSSRWVAVVCFLIFFDYVFGAIFEVSVPLISSWFGLNFFLRCMCNCAVAAILASVLLAFVVVIECSCAANCSSWCGRLLDFVVVVVVSYVDAGVMLQDVDGIVVVVVVLSLKVSFIVVSRLGQWVVWPVADS